MQAFWDVVLVVCTVVGAWTLLAGAVAALWFALVRARRQATGPLGRERRAQSWDEVPGWVARDREWAVAVVLLGAPSVAERTDPFVSFSERTIDWKGLLVAAATWSEDDRLLIYTAYDLASLGRDGTPSYGGDSFGHHVTLQQMAGVDDAVAARLQVAMDVRRGRCDYLTAVVRAGGLG